MKDVYYQVISENESGQRLDNYLLRILKGVPKSHIYRIIRQGEVRVNKKRAKAHTRLEAGDSVRIPPIRTAAEKVLEVSDSLEKLLQHCILFENESLLVINKPSGMAVHGGSGVSLGVIEALRKTRTDLHYLELVHRLDRDTSGCLVLAKKRSVLKAVQLLLAERKVTKTYWALLSHPWQGKKSLTVNKALQKNILKSGERMVSIDEEGKASETEFKLLENYSEACLVEASPKTGRTHQIRVHSASLDHTIIGDTKYGYVKGQIPNLGKKDSKLYLHARQIQFNLNGIQHHYVAEPDDNFNQVIALLRAGSLPNHG